MVAYQRDHTIVGAQAISRERTVWLGNASRENATSEGVIRERIPVISKREQDIDAMLLGQLNHFIQLLKSICAVINR